MPPVDAARENRPSGSVLVVGGGIAGMQSALDLANSGFFVYLVEKNISIGGVMAQLDKTFPTNDCSTCMISPKLIDVSSNPNIRVMTRTEVRGLEGDPGDFTVRLHQAPRFVDVDACSACGECVKVCPVQVPADFNEGLDPRKAIYRHFPQAIPSGFAIDKAGTAPCRAACPAGVSAQGYVALIAAGKYREALALERRDNPLPGICGRVCTHPCEASCTRGQVDEPVSIRHLKRFIADWEAAQGQMDLPRVKERRDENVAVIGSGPGGLSAAYYLALEGFQPVIYEALPQAGGMLRVGIPDYRLPPEILDYEIEYIKAVGVDIRLNTPVGPGLSLDELKSQGYAAVFLAAGAHRPLALEIEGEDLAGAASGVDFLREAALGTAACPGEKVAVIGGGNVAVDAARTALRLGSREVVILYRRSREEMPAYEEEIEEALEEGVRIEFLTAPVRFIGENGRLTGVETVQMELGEPDASGRRRPQPIAGSERVLAFDGALSAIGQAPDIDFLGQDGPAADKRGRIKADPVTLQTSIPWVFAGGDAVTGPAAAVDAVAAGKRAAESIRRFIQGLDLAEGRDAPQNIAVKDPSGTTPEPRRQPTALDPSARIKDFSEVVGPYSEEEARAEANRCLSCGICSECYQCVEACQARAVRHDQVPQDLDLRVGAVILAPGFRPFDARLKPEYGYGRLPNVITSLEFERINSASGPYGGHVQRPSDGTEPKKVAWIQCVGSRDPSIGRDYCSYVCCMYATKQAIIGMEHLPGMDTTIFYMDIRAQGKGFDRYYERAKEHHGVRYVRSLPSRIIENPADHDLEIQYFDEADNLVVETFNMVVLSVGLSPHPDAAALAQAVGIETDRFGFAQPAGVNQLATSRPGVYACGVFQAPRDIPETVMQASGAAAEAGAILARARGSETTSSSFPEERDVSGQEPRIGVFICHCGINIAGVVDVPAVVEYARTLPFVAHAQNLVFSCSTDSTRDMVDLIREHDLNRVLVASCSPRTHEPLFQEVLQNAGLNPYLFEMANIRDQCSWVHASDHEAATEKAKDLVRMSAARAALLEPVHKFPVPVEQSALVVGGGPSGLTAALTLADMGFPVHLVEKTSALGGVARRLSVSLEGDDVAAYLADLIDRAQSHALVTIHTESEVEEVTGRVGQFAAQVKTPSGKISVDHGAVVLAVGAAEYRPEEYLYGRDNRVLTQLELHESLHGSETPLEGVDRVVMIQCVGSRTEEHSYCSRVCCGQAVSNALRIKELNPKTDVTILFRDIRTYSLKELAYRRARDLGVRFIRFNPEEPPQASPSASGLDIKVKDQILGETIVLTADRLVLSAAIRPDPEAKRLASTLKLPLDADGFFMEAHLKLRPVDFVASGFFLAGTAHGPKFLEECAAQAKAAAARAAVVLSRREMMAGGEIAVVDQEKCVACLTCVRTCPYGVPAMDENHFAYIDPAGCQGCGSCAAACPRRAIQVRHHTDDQMIAKGQALLGPGRATR